MGVHLCPYLEAATAAAAAAAAGAAVTRSRRRKNGVIGRASFFFSNAHTHTWLRILLANFFLAKCAPDEG